MKSFSPGQLGRTVPMGLTWLVGSVMECRGRQELYEHQGPEILEALRQMALIQSVESSNRIEGVTVERERLKPLVLGRAEPRDRPEEEIVGYRQALAWIHENHNRIDLTPGTLLQMHRLAQGGTTGDAGQWKTRDNEVIEILPNGERRLRWKAVPAADTAEAVEALCLAYRHSSGQGLLPPLLAAGGFVLDFLCIHPFRDGNGRVSRLATLLLLYQQGFRVGRYISVERIVEESKESYYEALHTSSQGWHDAAHNPVPWWSYFLTTVRGAYREFEERVSRMAGRRGAKTDAIEHAIESLPREFPVSELDRLCPSVSRDLVRRVLRRRRDEGRLTCSSRGRGAIWRKT